MMRAFFFVLLSAVGCTAQHRSNEVSKVATDFRRFLLGDYSLDQLGRFYDDQSTLSFSSELPFSGLFAGEPMIKLFYKRLSTSFTIDNVQEKVIAVDEAKGTVLIDTQYGGTWTRTSEPANLKLFHVLEVNQLSGKIMTHLILDIDMQSTAETYRTGAEKNLSDLYWTIFNSDFTSIQKSSWPGWNKIAPDVEVTLNAFPVNAVASKSVWSGREDVRKLFVEMSQFHSQMNLKQQFANIGFKVLFANQRDVYARCFFNQGQQQPFKGVLVHYTFNAQGQVWRETVTMLSPFKPWEIRPFPFPHVQTNAPSWSLHQQQQQEQQQEQQQQQQPQPQQQQQQPPTPGYSTINVERIENFAHIQNLNANVELEMEFEFGGDRDQQTGHTIAKNIKDTLPLSTNRQPTPQQQQQATSSFVPFPIAALPDRFPVLRNQFSHFVCAVMTGLPRRTKIVYWLDNNKKDAGVKTTDQEGRAVLHLVMTENKPGSNEVSFSGYDEAKVFYFVEGQDTDFSAPNVAHLSSLKIFPCAY